MLSDVCVEGGAYEKACRRVCLFECWNDLFIADSRYINYATNIYYGTKLL